MPEEALIRSSLFAAVFVLLALLEAWRPWLQSDPNIPNKAQRWRSNLGLFLINTLLLRLCFPMAAVGIALYAEQQHWGVLALTPLSDTPDTPAIHGILAIIISLLLFDLLLYWQHRLFHTLPWLWQCHKVHHSDMALDISTGLRFSPLEIFISMLFKLLLIILLGPPVIAVLIFETWLSSSALFTHSNIRLPHWLERRLRYALVTPDMHRIHHSTLHCETDSNFASGLSCWDHLFGSYRASAQTPNPRIGLAEYRQADKLTLYRLLCMPFKN